MGSHASGQEDPVVGHYAMVISAFTAIQSYRVVRQGENFWRGYLDCGLHITTSAENIMMH